MNQPRTSGLGVRYFDRGNALIYTQDTGDDWTMEERDKWSGWLNDDRTTPDGQRFDQFEFYRILPQIPQ